MSTRSGASYTAGGSGTNSPTPPVDAAEVLDDPSHQHPRDNTNQPALLEVGGGPPDLAGRGDHLGPGQETPERFAKISILELNNFFSYEGILTKKIPKTW